MIKNVGKKEKGLIYSFMDEAGRKLSTWMDLEELRGVYQEDQGGKGTLDSMNSVWVSETWTGYEG